MKFEELPLKGAYLIEVEKLSDHRGFFGRLWCEREFAQHNLKTHFVQSNISYNRKKGTLRGLHYQKEPFQEIKLIRCSRGAFFDVIVDLRPESKTFKHWYGVELNEENCKMLYVPKNFAHGYLTLSDHAEAYYHVSEYYNSPYEGGLRFDDPEIGIQWPTEILEISEKDLKHKNFDVKNLV